MAGDWIKMRTDLYRDPKVCMMADMLMCDDGELACHVNQHCQRNMTVTRNVMRNVTVGALVSVWGVMRMQGKCEETDLVCDGVAIGVIDDIADLPGFGAVMEAVGWVCRTEDGLVFPRFFEDNNVAPAGADRSKGAVRQQRYRERQKAKCDVTSDVTSDVTVTPREEKSREEKIVDTSLRSVSTAPAEKPTPAVQKFDPLKALIAEGVPKQTAEDFLKIRKAKRAPLTQTALDAIRREAEAAAFSMAQAIETCCSRGWQGFKAEWVERDQGRSAPARANGRPSINDFGGDMPTGQYDNIFERRRA
ncbi:hypothetical protein F1_00032 [Ralstonia phage Heva]|uniref:Uncharacterized protein n=1 Tax=Ralstonia phage Heva TaxID=2759730 RepID=A0A7G5BAS2_9CAUD|nr:replication initiation protein [Ralstonia phage Heva]QMV33395.1 hypothetical protein F1_00032 [Ralstonia phage Heva]